MSAARALGYDQRRWENDEGQWEKGQRHGRGESHNPQDDSRYNGDWVEGKRQGYEEALPTRERLRAHGLTSLPEVVEVKLKGREPLRHARDESVAFIEPLQVDVGLLQELPEVEGLGELLEAASIVLPDNVVQGPPHSGVLLGRLKLSSRFFVALDLNLVGLELSCGLFIVGCRLNVRSLCCLD